MSFSVHASIALLFDVCGLLLKPVISMAFSQQVEQPYV